MQIFYTILFFADMIVLISSSYFFIQKVDNGHDIVGIAILLAGIISSITLLIILLLHYTKPPSKSHHE